MVYEFHKWTRKRKTYWLKVSLRSKIIDTKPPPTKKKAHISSCPTTSRAPSSVQTGGVQMEASASHFTHRTDSGQTAPEPTSHLPASTLIGVPSGNLHQGNRPHTARFISGSFYTQFCRDISSTSGLQFLTPRARLPFPFSCPKSLCPAPAYLLTDIQYLSPDGNSPPLWKIDYGSS